MYFENREIENRFFFIFSYNPLYRCILRGNDIHLCTHIRDHMCEYVYLFILKFLGLDRFKNCILNFLTFLKFFLNFPFSRHIGSLEKFVKCMKISSKNDKLQKGRGENWQRRFTLQSIFLDSTPSYFAIHHIRYILRQLSV